MALNFWNLTCPRFFVNISAGLFSPSMKYSSISFFLITSHIVEANINALDLFSVTGFEAINIAPWLSLQMGTVRTMVFTPDFSLLFCLTHFTFINFSHP